MIEALLEDAGKRVSEPELAELINPNDVDGEKRRLQGNHREKAYNHLCAKDGARWFWSSQDLNQD
jgi:hypothetical protein